MAKERRGRTPQLQGAGLIMVRYGIPAAFILVGQVVVIATGDWVSWAGFTGAGFAILLIGVLLRIGIAGDRERDREEAARAYFDEHGRWPDEDGPRSQRDWSLPVNAVTPESEAREREWRAARRAERDH